MRYILSFVKEILIENVSEHCKKYYVYKRSYVKIKYDLELKKCADINRIKNKQ